MSASCWLISIQDAWHHYKDTPKLYSAGSWGPIASVALLAGDGRAWEELLNLHLTLKQEKICIP
jgi:glucose-6-phosphate 1-dehydrogenase